MTIIIGSDHGGYVYKTRLIEDLKTHGYDTIDVGANDENASDYPIFARKVAELVQKDENSLGVILCTSGEGVTMTANKVKGIRCGIGYNDEVAASIREHNHANMIAFGAKFMEYEDVLRRIIIFINTPEAGGRHDRRVALINELDN